MYKDKSNEFDYGPLNRLAVFTETHPEVMKEMISNMNWKDKLQYTGKPSEERELHKHERFRSRFLSFIAKYLNGGKQIGGFKNYKLTK